LKPSIISTV